MLPSQTALAPPSTSYLHGQAQQVALATTAMVTTGRASDDDFDPITLLGYGKPFSPKLISLAREIMYVDPTTTTTKKHHCIAGHRYCPTIRDYESAHAFYNDGRGKDNVVLTHP